MSITISPLELMLDEQNPRFVILKKRDQANIRKYLVMYEDVCQLATAINGYGGLLPGERIVVLKENGKYIVVEGNRRTCSLQMLLSRDLIPDGFGHKIPTASNKVTKSCQSIEVDVLTSRNAALELMSKRHIEGVKGWKPIAKKQFFAANYEVGQSIQNLSKITSIKESDIKADIQDYKFFLYAFNKYQQSHKDFNSDIINLKIDPFLRIFKAKICFPAGDKVRPVDILQIYHDENYNTLSRLDTDLFNQIVQLIFTETTITEHINTRNVMTDVNGIMPLLEQSINSQQLDANQEAEQEADTNQNNHPLRKNDGSTESHGENGPSNNEQSENNDHNNEQSGGPVPGGPVPGGPSPRVFFETISWEGKLDPSKLPHQGFMIALNELYHLSKFNCNRQKAYQVFPIATGMILRSVYEQALTLRLKQVNLWGQYMQSLSSTAFPTLSSIENFIKQGVNKNIVLPNREMVDAFDRIITATHRDFLNANIHNPGNIHVTSDSLEGISSGGMFFLIQSIINLLP